MNGSEIQNALFALRDEQYRDFQRRLIPTLAPEIMIGVRTPALRALAKELAKDGGAEDFLNALPHRYFDENQLHAFLISGMKDFDRCLAALKRFLPYVDNWATCDQMSPKVFQKHRAALLAQIPVWLASGETYTVRFALGMLMEHFLDGDFDPRYLEWAASLRSEEYYVRMMVAWYFATALAKQYDAALPWLEERRLDPWTHNKTVQKAIESCRIPDARKAHLKTLRLRGTITVF